jgi:hypothetical protein
MLTWLGWWLYKFVCWTTNSLGSLGSNQQPDEMVNSLVQVINVMDFKYNYVNTSQKQS